LIHTPVERVKPWFDVRLLSVSAGFQPLVYNLPQGDQESRPKYAGGVCSFKAGPLVTAPKSYSTPSACNHLRRFVKDYSCATRVRKIYSRHFRSIHDLLYDLSPCFSCIQLRSARLSSIKLNRSPCDGERVSLNWTALLPCLLDIVEGFLKVIHSSTIHVLRPFDANAQPALTS
jgi:hypothetical protein